MTSDFEQRFIRSALWAAFVSTPVCALAIGLTGDGHEVPGVLVGFLGAIVALVTHIRGHHALSVRLFLGLCALGAAIASSVAPTPESIGSAANTYLVIACFAALMLTVREMLVLGMLCWLALVALTVRVVMLDVSPTTGPGAAVALSFLPVAFVLLGVVSQHFRSTIHRLEVAEKEARASLETRSRFLANMSHELRTPLNAILGYTEILEEEHQGDPSTLEDLGRITRSGNLLLSHIDALLDLSKIEAGHAQHHVEQVSVPALVEEVVDTHRALFDARGNTLEVEVPDLLPLHTDYTKAGQILHNLLSNANKFTEHGAVTLTVAPEEGGVRFQVIDTGIGIDAEALPHLFDAFTQADTSTTRRFGGTGLGLALVKEFATMLGGTVEVNSEPGVGSTFSVWLADLAPEPYSPFSIPPQELSA